MPKPMQKIGGLTPGQVKLLTFMRDYIKQHGFAPSIEEMADQCEWASKSAPSRVLDQLEADGLIKRVAGRRRAIEITPAGLAKLP